MQQEKGGATLREVGDEPSLPSCQRWQDFNRLGLSAQTRPFEIFPILIGLDMRIALAAVLR